MTIEEIHQLLLDQFGAEKITAINTEAIDPWIEVAADAIVEVSTFLKTDERLRFEHLNNLSGVDYCEPDEKKKKKFDHEPHVEVVYHLSSYSVKHRAVIKVLVPRWQNDVEGDIPEIPTVSTVWAAADWHERGLDVRVRGVY